MISIFDDSSCKSSDNSQDDDQFRARREFLKSGLPDSLRKQIAKTTATKEAYSLSCSSFQLVTHTKQAFNGRSLHQEYRNCPYFAYLNRSHPRDIQSLTSYEHTAIHLQFTMIKIFAKTLMHGELAVF